MSFVPFAIAMLVLAITPGPGVFAVLGRALSSGLRPAAWMIVGIIAGDLLFLALAAGGLTVLAHTLGDVFLLVRIAGASYLIWLGLKAWQAQPGPISPLESEKPSGRRNLLTGFFLTLGNPKVILFYAGFLPTFLPIDQMTLLQWLHVAGLVTVILGAALGSYAVMAEAARSRIIQPGSRRLLNRVAGSLMIGTGAVLLARQ